MDERAYWVAWSRLPRMGGRRIMALYEHFGSLAAAWEASERRLKEVLGTHMASDIVAARTGRDPAADWAAVNRAPTRVLTWVDEDYPASLRQLSDPPPALYLLGRLPDWRHGVAIVGAREASDYGLMVARRLGQELAGLGVAVISGAAAGIDGAAHEGALGVADGWTAGVLGCGFHHVFPASHRRLYRAIAERGSLLSEYPQDVLPLKGHFPHLSKGGVISSPYQGRGWPLKLLPKAPLTLTRSTSSGGRPNASWKCRTTRERSASTLSR